jgi:NADH:ubiquinone oxidoreductase subunit 2 (subunit N)
MLLGVVMFPRYSGAVEDFYTIFRKLRSVEGNTHAVLYYAHIYGLTTIGAFDVVSVVERVPGRDGLDAFLGLLGTASARC